MVRDSDQWVNETSVPCCTIRYSSGPGHVVLTTGNFRVGCPRQVGTIYTTSRRARQVLWEEQVLGEQKGPTDLLGSLESLLRIDDRLCWHQRSGCGRTQSPHCSFTNATSRTACRKSVFSRVAKRISYVTPGLSMFQ